MAVLKLSLIMYGYFKNRWSRESNQRVPISRNVRIFILDGLLGYREGKGIGKTRRKQISLCYCFYSMVELKCFLERLVFYES